MDVAHVELWQQFQIKVEAENSETVATWRWRRERTLNNYWAFAEAWASLWMSLKLLL